MGIAFLESTEAGIMSGAEFRAFQGGRPDGERWELIGGVPIMMAPATVVHNSIADNLCALLNQALKQHRPSIRAVSRFGVELNTDSYKPEPDVGVIDRGFVAGQRFIDRAYLLAEVVSSTDRMLVPGYPERWIDVKREIYLAHAPCEAVLLIEQDRIEVRLDLRIVGEWQSTVLTRPDAKLSLPSFGLNCAVSELYEGTPLERHAS